jgi:hypothetical protein
MHERMGGERNSGERKMAAMLADAHLDVENV